LSLWLDAANDRRPIEATACLPDLSPMEACVEQFTPTSLPR
jgi:hypothetical protein